MPAPIAGVELASLTRSSDAGHLASADISSIAQTANLEFRLVGGNAISLLVWAHELRETVPERETNDADLGIPSMAAGSADLVEALLAKDYQQIQGNRFVREVDHGAAPLELFIDVLIPSYTGRLETNQPFGELVVDAVPGLAIAIARTPTVVEVSTTLTTGESIEYVAPLPDPVAALCMKAYAYRGRLADRDAIDIWRLCEVAHALDLKAADWPTSATGRGAGAILYQHFAMPGGGGPARATTDRRSQARIRALIQPGASANHLTARARAVTSSSLPRNSTPSTALIASSSSFAD